MSKLSLVLSGEFSIADAMFALVALRFASYHVPVDEMASAYVESVRKHPRILEWLAAAASEPEVIEQTEVAALPRSAQ